VRHLNLGLSLFVLSSLASTVTWFSTAPELSLNNSPYTPVPPRVVENDNAAFIKQVKIALRQRVAAKPFEDIATKDLSPIRVSIHFPGEKISKVKMKGDGKWPQNHRAEVAVNLIRYTPSLGNVAEQGKK
jgi:hypothetical protein